MSKRVANKISRFDLTFEVDATPDYSAGDVIDGLLTIDFAGRYGLSSGCVEGGIIHNLASHAIDLELVLFKDNPSNTTFTDNSALGVADADLDLILGVLPFTRHKQFADNSVSMPAVDQRDIPFELGIDADGRAVTSLYAVLLAGGTINFASASDLSGALFIRHD